MNPGVQDSILKYIHNEKDIARYKISRLERSDDPSPAQKRIISIEKEFINLPLEDMCFEDIADVAAAISIYRTSRSQFFEIYKIKNIDHAPISKSALINKIIKKINFINYNAQAMKNSRVQEFNYVQNSELYYELVKRQSTKNNSSFDIEKKFLDKKSLKYLLNIEPITLAKKRARCQAVTYSIGAYLEESLPKYRDEMTLEELISYELKLDNVINSIENNAFKYFDKAIQILPSILKNTMGENQAIERLHELQNILDFKSLEYKKCNPNPISNTSGFHIDAPLIGNLFFGSKKAIVKSPEKDAERNIQNKIFGILLPIPREGNEKMTLLHKEIFINNKNISHLFSDDLSNIKANGIYGQEYFKALLMHPLWKLYDISKRDEGCKNILSNLIGLNDEISGKLESGDRDIINKINNTNCGFINISSNSRALTAKTRSEEEGFSEINSIIKSKILEIKQEYNSLELRE
jgi:hypothetical protein